MKVWEKIYMVVTLLFLVVLNICNVLVFRSVYRESVNTVEQKAMVEWKNIAVPLSEDLGELGGGQDGVWELFQAYVSSYSTDGYAFELWQDGNLQYKSGIGSQMTYSYLEGKLESSFIREVERQNEILVTGEQKGKTTIVVKDEDKFTCTSGMLAGTSYQFVMYERVSGILQVWKKQLFIFLFVEIAASVLMAVLLYFIIRKFLRPIDRLSEAAARVAAGDYECQIEVEGHDEISDLSRDMNWMIGQIKENIENKEQEAAHKQEFIDALSHEMRTPLTSVRGYAQLVESTNLAEDKRIEYMDYIVKESGRMMGIMETLREMILMRQGALEKEEISLPEFTDEIKRLTELQMADKEISFTFRVTGERIYGNRTLLELLFMNILRNSYRACEAGGRITVDVSDERTVIEDNGVGMSEECLAHVFEPFYREDKSRSRKMGGSGLGMYLCRQIIDLHGWQIEIESEKGKGTKIFFTTSLQADEDLEKSCRYDKSVINVED